MTKWYATPYMRLNGDTLEQAWQKITTEPMTKMKIEVEWRPIPQIGNEIWPPQ